MLIDRLALVAFFDDDDEAGRHASAIKAVAGEELGLALLVRYLTTTGSNPERLSVACTQRFRKGHRLDAWVRVTSDTGPLLYQVEVKTWSSHSIGGARLPSDACAADVRAFKLREWAGYFDDTRGFREKALQKVFDPMTPPEADTRVEPLACLWTAVHNQGGDEPFFQVPVAAPCSASFNVINVFSMSAYLRGLLDAEIELRLPDTERRLQYLSSLFRPTPALETAIEG